MSGRTIRKSIWIFIGFSYCLHGYDTMHFYRATPLFPEPRLGRDFLGSFDIAFSGGSTHTAFNRCQEKVPLLDVYGTHNMQQLGVNVPNKDLTNPLDLILIQLALLPADSTFGILSIDGEFHFLEAQFAWTQNFIHGFFGEVYLALRRLCIKDICITDLTECSPCCPTNTAPQWQAFLNNFDAILNRYGLSKDPFCSTEIGDLTLFAGWTYNYQDTTVLDFVDTTVRLGVCIPTSHFPSQEFVFALPHGYCKNVGVPISAQFSFGAYEWVTFGAHIETIVFAKTTHNIRMKTALYQTGMFKLAQGDAEIARGTIWRSGAFVKADHFVRGLSCLLGYSFVEQNRTFLTPCDRSVFNASIVNTDQALRGWKMHTMHLFAEYDFTREDSEYGLRIGLFADLPVSGKRIFQTNSFGGSCGIDIVWNI